MKGTPVFFNVHFYFAPQVSNNYSGIKLIKKGYLINFGPITYICSNFCNFGEWKKGMNYLNYMFNYKS